MIARQTAYIYLQTVHTAFQSLIFASYCDADYNVVS